MGFSDVILEKDGRRASVICAGSVLAAHLSVDFWQSVPGFSEHDVIENPNEFSVTLTCFLMSWFFPPPPLIVSRV